LESLRKLNLKNKIFLNFPMKFFVLAILILGCIATPSMETIKKLEKSATGKRILDTIAL
jgi:hypothetical protein